MPVELLDCRYGKMLVRPNDRYLGRSLKHYGEFSEGEVEVFRGYIKPDMIVIDVGANIGAHTVPLAQMAKAVLAFEPVRANFQMLCANLALNDIRNVFAYQLVMGAQTGVVPVPILDLDVEQNNFGSVRLAEVKSPVGCEPVPMNRLDELIDHADFIKIDVEGMEKHVIAGARDLIAKSRPILYVEDDNIDEHVALATMLLDLDYIPFWHTPTLFNKNNFYNREDDIFPGLASFNLFCVPKEKRDHMNVEGEPITRETVEAFPMKEREQWNIPHPPSV